MKKAWRKLDLSSDELQTLNARYTRLMRHKPLAFMQPGCYFPLVHIDGICMNPTGPLPISVYPLALQ